MKKVLKMSFLALGLISISLASYAQCQPFGSLLNDEQGKCIKYLYPYINDEGTYSYIKIEYCDLSQLDPYKICWVPIFPE